MDSFRNLHTNRPAPHDEYQEPLKTRRMDFMNAAAASTTTYTYGDKVVDRNLGLFTNLHPMTLPGKVDSSPSKPTLNFNLSVKSAPLKRVPQHFQRDTSIISSHSTPQDLFNNLGSALSQDCNVDYEHSERDHQINGIVFESGQNASFEVNVFQAEQGILAEFKRIYGCAFAFHAFYCRIVEEPTFKAHIKAFITQSPIPFNNIPLALELLDNPPMDLSDPLFDLPTCGSFEEQVGSAVDMLKSQYVEDRKDGVCELMRLCRSDQANVKAFLQVVGALAHGELLLSNDTEIARNSCEIVEIVCKAASEMHEKCIETLLAHFECVLDAPDSLLTRRCKYHLIKSLEVLSKSCAHKIPADWVDILKPYESNAVIRESVGAILGNIVSVR